MYFSVSRKVAALALGLQLFTLPIFVLAAGDAAHDAPAVGQIIFADAITVNSQRATAGTTIFSGSRLDVTCAVGNWALIKLKNLGLIQLAPGTQITLQFSTGIIGGELTAGKAIIHHETGVKVAIQPPDGIAAEKQEQANVLAVTAPNHAQCTSAKMQTATKTLTERAGALAASLVGLQENAVSTNTAWAGHDASAFSVLP